MIKKLIAAIRKHKFTAGLVLIALIAVGFFIYQVFQKEANQISYEVQSVSKGNIEKVISATGQMEDINQVDITPKVTGEVTQVNVEVGSEVKAGDTLFVIDSAELEQDITKAQLALESAQIQLNQMKEIDSLSVMRAENELESAKNNLSELKVKQEQEMEQAEEDRDNAQEDLDDMDEDDPQYEATEDLLADALRKIDSYNLSHPIEISEAEAKIAEQEASLADVKSGPSDEDLRMQQIAIQEKQMSLDKLVESREDYSITAPNDGMIVELNVEVGEDVSSGGSSSQSSESQAAVSMISNKVEAIVIINEVDILNIEEGQKATLTLDAIEDLELTGKVSKVDQLGTEDQGVVSHDVTISLDEQDERIKDGMSVNADIIVASKEDVLTVPVSAVTTMGERNTVQIVTDDVTISRSGEVTGVQTRMVEVTTGISDDVNLEISEGLEVGDIVVLDIIEPDSDDEEDSSNSQNNQRPGGEGMPFEGRAMGAMR